MMLNFVFLKFCGSVLNLLQAVVEVTSCKQSSIQVLRGVE